MRDSQERQRSADIAAARCKAELEQAEAGRKRIEVAGAEHDAELTASLQSAQAELRRVQADLDERTMQLSVLTDTVEALQIGSVGEREQRIVDLTTQLVAARMRDAASMRRAEANAKDAACDRQRAADAQRTAESAAAEARVAGVSAATLKQQLQSAAADVAAARQDAKATDAERQKLAATLDDAVQKLAAAEREVASLVDAQRSAAARHCDQLASERASARELRERDAAASFGGSAEPPHLARMREQMRALTQEVQQAAQSAEGGLHSGPLAITEHRCAVHSAHSLKQVRNGWHGLDDLSVVCLCRSVLVWCR